MARLTLLISWYFFLINVVIYTYLQDRTTVFSNTRTMCGMLPKICQKTYLLFLFFTCIYLSLPHTQITQMPRLWANNHLQFCWTTLKNRVKRWLHGWPTGRFWSMQRRVSKDLFICQKSIQTRKLPQQNLQRGCSTKRTHMETEASGMVCFQALSILSCLL